jgi:hypothetical protein
MSPPCGRRRAARGLSQSDEVLSSTSVLRQHAVSTLTSPISRSATSSLCQWLAHCRAAVGPLPVLD